MRIILASGSPRRKELLKLAGYDFVTEVSKADEETTVKAPDELVELLSLRKAEAVANNHIEEAAADDYHPGTAIMDGTQKHHEDCLIIGADTVVALDGKILGKPGDEKEAAEMLRDLSGRTHQVYTGVSLLFLEGQQISGRRTFSECTDVTMRTLSDAEIDAYISSGEPMDKAGAYGIQGKAAVFISGIRGDYYNVVGLPVCRLVEEIKKYD